MNEILQSLPGFMLIVNVVVLLSALFFFTSTVASHLVEAWAGALNSRGRQLKARLVSVLGEEDAKKIYEHPLIRSISSGVNAVSGNVDTLKPPSYIEPKIFAEAIKNLSAEGKLSDNAVMNQIKASAGAAAADFEPKLLDWFKAINDHQTGVYTRWTFLKLVTIGFLFAAAMDIDTVQIASMLWKNPQQTETLAKAMDNINQLNTSGGLNQLSEADRAKVNEAVAAAVQTMRTVVPPKYAWQSAPKDALAWLSKLLGWTLTALATSLGAQFWFNIMSEALKLRAGPPKPEVEKKPAGQQRQQAQQGQQ